MIVADLILAVLWIIAAVVTYYEILTWSVGLQVCLLVALALSRFERASLRHDISELERQ